MAKHPLSYWRTTAASAAAMIALTALMAALLAWGWSWPTEAAYWAPYLGLGLAELLMVPLTAASGLIAAGGLIALRRDSLETKGKPYAQSSPREATSSFPIAALRVVLGLRRFGFCPGDFVEIRPLDEILQTLDDNGTLDGVPFIPEMAAFCGKRARVLRRVDKLNDWIHGTGLKRMHGLVLLADLRCDGSARGKCQSNCHLRWREEWLRPADRAGSADKFPEQAPPQQSQLAALSAFASRQSDAGAGTHYVYQATELTAGGSPLRMADPCHYARDSNPCFVLDGVTATGEYQGFNPENEYIFWRERSGWNELRLRICSRRLAVSLDVAGISCETHARSPRTFALTPGPMPTNPISLSKVRTGPA